MFGGFILRLLIGAFVAPFAFSFMVVPLKLVVVSIGRRLTSGATSPAWLTYVVLSLITPAQLYFWGLWAAYCAALAVSRAAYPEVTHSWFYYAAALLSVVLPLAWLRGKEREMASSQRHARFVDAGTALYSSVAIVAFVVFVFWPGVMRTPYGWALDRTTDVRALPALDATERALEQKYFADLDAWVARGPLFQPGEQGNDAAVKARIQPMAETCGKLVMLTASANERALLMSNRTEFDFRVDVCTKMTINRLHAQPEFQNPELVRVICNSSNLVFRRLCVRSGLRS
jgi:hypothetical protein